MGIEAGALAVLVAIVLVLAGLGLASLRYGADSRPGVGDRDRRPWLVPPRSGL